MTKSGWSFWVCCSRMTEKLLINDAQSSLAASFRFSSAASSFSSPLCHHKHLAMYHLYSSSGGQIIWDPVLESWNPTKYSVLCRSSSLIQKGAWGRNRCVFGCVPLEQWSLQCLGSSLAWTPAFLSLDPFTSAAAQCSLCTARRR